MRRNNTINPRKAKQIARQKYAERQIDKWVKWSWENLGKVSYKNLVKHQEKFKIECHGWTRTKRT